MARGRFINKTITTDPKVAALTANWGAWAAVFHHRLIAFLDINGNVRADQFWLKANIFPLDSGVSPSDCRKFSRALVEAELALPYLVDGIEYLHFPNFEKNQHGIRKDREKPDYPEYKHDVGNFPETFPQNGGNLPEDCQPTRGNLTTISVSSPSTINHLPSPKGDSSIGAIDLDHFLADWNQMASELGYAKIGNLTEGRKAKLKTRTREPAFNFDAILQAFRKFKPAIEERNGRKSWKPDFDYVIKSEDTYTGILEGKFRTDQSGPKQPGCLVDDGRKLW